MNILFVWFYKNENGRRHRSSSYFDGRAPQLSASVNHGTVAAGLIGHSEEQRFVIIKLFSYVEGLLKIHGEENKFLEDLQVKGCADSLKF